MSPSSCFNVFVVFFDDGMRQVFHIYPTRYLTLTCEKGVLIRKVLCEVDYYDFDDDNGGEKGGNCLNNFRSVSFIK